MQGAAGHRTEQDGHQPRAVPAADDEQLGVGLLGAGDDAVDRMAAPGLDLDGRVRVLVLPLRGKVLEVPLRVLRSFGTGSGGIHRVPAVDGR